MKRILPYIFTLLSLASIFTWAETPKQSVVLYPVQVDATEDSKADHYGNALQEGLQDRYKVYYGPAVEQFLQKEYKKTNCDAETCSQNISIEFQTSLIGDASVDKTEGGYILSFKITDIITKEILESKTIPCKACDTFQVIEQLKLLGKLSSNSTQLLSQNKDNSAILVFDSIPTGLPISINNVPSGKTPYQGMNHHIGEKLNIKISDNHFQAFEAEITLNTEVFRPAPVQLQPGKGWITVVANPFSENTRVFIDNQEVGISPLKHEVTAGIHNVYVKTSNKTSVVTNTDVFAGAKNDLTFDLTDAPPPVTYSPQTDNSYTPTTPTSDGRAGIMGGLGVGFAGVSTTEEYGSTEFEYESAFGFNLSMRLGGGWDQIQFYYLYNMNIYETTPTGSSDSYDTIDTFSAPGLALYFSPSAPSAYLLFAQGDGNIELTPAVGSNSTTTTEYSYSGDSMMYGIGWEFAKSSSIEFVLFESDLINEKDSLDHFKTSTFQISFNGLFY